MPHITKKKARKIFKHGKVRGKKISKKQHGLFGAASKGKARK